jgi:DNA-binding YbaB/EbfC family protein
MAKGLQKLIKEAQKMQSKMLSAQEELETESVEGTAGGGMVKVVMNGKQQITSIKIQKEAVDPNDIEMLEDLVIAACNQAHENMQNMINQKMGSFTGGLSIPGLTA